MLLRRAFLPATFLLVGVFQLQVLADDDQQISQAFHTSGFDGTQFVNKCEIREAGVDRSYDRDSCLSYIMGVTDAHAQQIALSGGKFKGYYCLPETIQPSELLNDTLEYIDDHPEEEELLAAYLITSALNKAYPCKN